MKIRVEMVWMIAAAMPALAQSGAGAKGIFLDDGDSRPALKFNVSLDRGGQQKTVPVTHAFLDGDKMKFRFELSKDGYIYVLHRSIEADPSKVDRYAGSRGIEIIRDEDRQGKKGAYQLLFPNQASGQSNLVKAHATKTIPSSAASYFTMDNRPGMEKLIVVVSAKPIDIAKYFDPRTGKLKDSAGDGGSKPRAGSDEDVLGQLTQTLLEYSGNADVQSPKGIDIVDGYAAPKIGSKPMLVPVDLKHLPGTR